MAKFELVLTMRRKTAVWLEAEISDPILMQHVDPNESVSDVDLQLARAIAVSMKLSKTRANMSLPDVNPVLDRFKELATARLMATAAHPSICSAVYRMIGWVTSFQAISPIDKLAKVKRPD
jgi:hypothetical protein